MPSLKSVLNVTATCLLSFLLLGCNEEDSVDSMSDIVGVFDNSIDRGDGVIDELYIHIAESGETIEYDYMGDDYDQGSDCYDSWWYDQLSHVEGNLFYSEDGASHLKFEILADGALRASNPDDPSEYLDYPAANKSVSDMESKFCLNASSMNRNIEKVKKHSFLSK